MKCSIKELNYWNEFSLMILDKKCIINEIKFRVNQLKFVPSYKEIKCKAEASISKLLKLKFGKNFVK